MNTRFHDINKTLRVHNKISGAGHKRWRCWPTHWHPDARGQKTATHPLQAVWTKINLALLLSRHAGNITACQFQSRAESYGLTLAANTCQTKTYIAWLRTYVNQSTKKHVHNIFEKSSVHLMSGRLLIHGWGIEGLFCYRGWPTASTQFIPHPVELTRFKQSIPLASVTVIFSGSREYKVPTYRTSDLVMRLMGCPKGRLDPILPAFPGFERM